MKPTLVFSILLLCLVLNQSAELSRFHRSQKSHKSRKSLKKTKKHEYEKSFLETQRTRLDGMLTSIKGYISGYEVQIDQFLTNLNMGNSLGMSSTNLGTYIDALKLGLSEVRISVSSEINRGLTVADSADSPYSWPGLTSTENLSKTRLLAIVFAKATKGYPKILPGNADDLTANNGNIPNRRIWTLLHELTHVSLGSRNYMKTSKCSLPEISQDYRSSWTTQNGYTQYTAEASLYKNAGFNYSSFA